MRSTHAIEIKGVALPPVPAERPVTLEHGGSEEFPGNAKSNSGNQNNKLSFKSHFVNEGEKEFGQGSVDATSGQSCSKFKFNENCFQKNEDISLNSAPLDSQLLAGQFSSVKEIEEAAESPFDENPVEDNMYNFKETKFLTWVVLKNIQEFSHKTMDTWLRRFQNLRSMENIKIPKNSKKIAMV